MSVTVIKGGTTYTMGYDPCHYDGLVEFYAKALKDGEIESFTIEL